MFLNNSSRRDVVIKSILCYRFGFTNVEEDFASLDLLIHDRFANLILTLFIDQYKISFIQFLAQTFNLSHIAVMLFKEDSV